MPEMKALYPGGRAYGRVVFERSTYEVDSVATTTATVTLVDPAGTEVSVTPTVTADTDSAQIDWEYTLPTAAVPGPWQAVTQTATALIATDLFTFRVLRRPDL
jgi:hypothetical protein